MVLKLKENEYLEIYCTNTLNTKKVSKQSKLQIKLLITNA